MWKYAHSVKKQCSVIRNCKSLFKHFRKSNMKKQKSLRSRLPLQFLLNSCHVCWCLFTLVEPQLDIYLLCICIERCCSLWSALWHSGSCTLSYTSLQLWIWSMVGRENMCIIIVYIILLILFLSAICYFSLTYYGSLTSINHSLENTEQKT